MKWVLLNLCWWNFRYLKTKGIWSILLCYKLKTKEIWSIFKFWPYVIILDLSYGIRFMVGLVKIESKTIMSLIFTIMVKLKVIWIDFLRKFHVRYTMKNIKIDGLVLSKLEIYEDLICISTYYLHLNNIREWI